MAIHGGLSYGPAPTTCAVYSPLTAWAAVASRANRSTNEGSAASSGWQTLTATARPPGE